MWFLVSQSTGAKFFLLQDRPKYVVSRNEQCGDLVLAGDSSISRLHAFLYPNKSHVKVIDDGSKYGVFINDNIHTDVPVTSHQPTELVAGDKIRFGRLQNVWHLEALPLATLSSTLSVQEKLDLKKDMDILNGSLLNDWNASCNYMTVSNLTITIKVLQALSAAIPIVTPQFWKTYIEAVRKQSPPPIPDATFLPSISEPFIPADVSFMPNINRKRLFAGKTLVFMIRGHKDKFIRTIKLAGGTALSLDDNKIRKGILIDANTIVVQYNPSTQSQTTQDISTITDYIRSKGLRTIPDCEIGLAIVHCSIAKFCNPQFKLDEDFVVATNQQQQLKTSKVLAENTPTDEHVRVQIDIEVAETVQSEKTIAQTSGKPTVSSQNKIAPLSIDCADRSTRSKRQASSPIASEAGPASKRKLDASSNSRNEEVFSFESKSMESVIDPKSSCGYIDIDDDDDDVLLASMIDNVESIEAVPAQMVATIPLASPGHSQRSTGYISTNRNRTVTVTTKAVSSSPINQKRVHKLLSTGDSSDDDSDDNLFAFEKAPVAVKRQRTMDQVAHERLFMFSTPVSSQHVPKKNVSDLTATTLQNTRNASTTFDLSHIKPIAITSNGWLSKSQIKSAVKTEPNVTTDGVKSEENKAWICSIQNVFVAKFKQMKLVNRSVQNPNVVAADKSNAGNVKNFKAFVKKYNYPPQTTIIRTTANQTVN